MYQLSHLLIEQRNILSSLKNEDLTENAKGMIDETEEKGKCQKCSCIDLNTETY